MRWIFNLFFKLPFKCTRLDIINKQNSYTNINASYISKCKYIGGTTNAKRKDDIALRRDV